MGDKHRAASATFLAMAALGWGGCGDASSSTPVAPSSPPAPDAGAISTQCPDGDPHHERYGTPCRCCHAEFGIAGSIDLSGPPIARIVVTDTTGVTAEMGPDLYGNFFRHYQPHGALQATVFGVNGAFIAMQAAAPDGDCNRCHAPGAVASRIKGPP